MLPKITCVLIQRKDETFIHTLKKLNDGLTGCTCHQSFKSYNDYIQHLIEILETHKIK